MNTTIVAENNLSVRMNGTIINTLGTEDGGQSATLRVQTPEEFLQLVRDLETLGFHGDKTGYAPGPGHIDYRGDSGIKSRRGPQGNDYETTKRGDSDYLQVSALTLAIEEAMTKGERTSGKGVHHAISNLHAHR